LETIGSGFGGNSNSPFAILLVYSTVWFTITGLALGFVFLVNGYLKIRGPKKIGIATTYLTSTSVDSILKSDPNFDVDNFLTNVHKLASKLNTAWIENKMELVRNLVSAGIYNRFKIQLELMKLQDIQNLMKNWVLESATIVAVDSDDVYQIIHVELHAYAKDVNISISLQNTEKQKLLEEAAQTDYYEIWSFVRKKDVITKKQGGVLSGICPNCGGDIQNLGELNQCKYCHAIINSGDYDWVLAEITQKVEWNESSSSQDVTRDARAKNPSVNRQVIEDRASYLFWRWIEARAKGSGKYLQRDASKEVQASIQRKEFLADVAVGASDLKQIEEKDGYFLATVKILWSASFSQGKEPTHQRSKFVLSLPVSLIRKGGLSSNSCESCGAPLPESDAIKCDYCNADIPPQVNDWILTGVNTKS
ncbi:MAG: TIM44-like domain-containing protein, partial [Leptospiraceae bacterium]|nr:TIM44-like domain-containing protein [Leptospiraceae bacterium]